MKAQELFQDLKHRIRTGELTGKLPSIAEMISAYHVSHNTVKKALDMLKMQHLAYGMQGKGVYVRNYVAPKREGGRVYVCCSWNCLHNAFYLRLLEMLRAKAASEALAIDFINDLRGFRGEADDLLCLVQETALPDDRMLQRGDPPALLGINPENPLPEGRHIPVCSNDNFAGGYMAMEYLYRHGHRKIGIVAYGLDFPENIFHLRVRGAEQFAAEHPDVELACRNIVSLKHAEEELAAAGLPGGNSEKSAFFALTDGLAMQVINRLRALGRRVPEEVSVIGYDNSVFSGMLSPALTTIEEDAEAMAEAVLSMIREHRAGRRIEKDVFIKPELIERASVAELHNDHR